MKNKRIILVVSLTCCLGVSTLIYFQKLLDRSLSDEALLSIIKNDQSGFEHFLSRGGKLGMNIKVEGEHFMIGELIVKYNRLGFAKYAKDQKLQFEIDIKKDFDIHSLSVEQNNPEMLGLLLGNQKFDKMVKAYGKKGRSLLHMASAHCSYKVVSILHKAGMSWDHKDSIGVTPLTLAAEEGCLQALSYFKEQGADFKAKDGRGRSALSILQKHKDAALMAFAESFIDRRATASVVVVKQEVPNFYKKRKIPKDSFADRAHLIEPEDRPDDANETSEYSEFSD